MSTSTTNQSTLNVNAARVLGLEHVEIETVTVRPAGRGDLSAVTETGQPLHGYARDQAGFLLPAVLDRHTTSDVFAAVPRTRPSGPQHVPDQNTVVGQQVHLDGFTAFGSGISWTSWTTEEAEGSSALLGTAPMSVKPFYVDDPDGTPLPLMPVYGAQATVSILVEGIDPDLLAEKVEALLVAEFGDALGKNRKVKTRPVENRRVDVVDATSGTLHAVGILAAEVPFVMERRGTVETRAHQRTDGLIIGS